MSLIAGIKLQAFDPNLFAENWTAVALSAVVAAVAIGTMFAASRVLSARRYSETKLTPYECQDPSSKLSAVL